MPSCTRVVPLVPHTNRPVAPVSGRYFAKNRTCAVTSSSFYFPLSGTEKRI